MITAGEALFRVILDSSGLEKNVAKATKDINALRRTAEATQRTFNRFGYLIAATFGAHSIGALVQFSDQWVNINSKLKIATGSIEDMQTALLGLQAISNSTLTGIDANITLFSRLTNATKRYGLEQKQVLLLTEAVANSLRVSGATTQEAQSTMLQFSQAMAAGRLNGQ